MQYKKYDNFIFLHIISPLRMATEPQLRWQLQKMYSS